jgi:uncharacterized repeat protein (TIGR03803 family)
MKSRYPQRYLYTLLFMSLIVTFTFAAVSTASAQTENVLFSIQGSTDGSSPHGGVILDSAGNLYGTSQYGVEFGSCCGAAWELSPDGRGGYNETVLHTFVGKGGGGYPYAGLVLDAAGNLYGTASTGGNLSSCNGQGCGVVFELSPNGSGGWTETVIRAFSGGRDGANPWAGLIFDSAGNLYGTTASGGKYGFGVVFELSPGASGWTETVLHGFTNGNDGGTPYSALTMDSAGNLYGTTLGGGIQTCSAFAAGCGVVYELSPVSGAGWKESVLHFFNETYGQAPEGGVVFDAAGNLYGTAVAGGELNGCDGDGCGIVYKLAPTKSGQWTFTAIHQFTDTARSKGFYPEGNLYLDSSGDIYGTTSQGGTCLMGTIYKLTPGSGGNYGETIVHAFGCNSTDGAEPLSGMIFDGVGNLYGTTSQGGKNSFGTVYRFTP